MDLSFNFTLKSDGYNKEYEVEVEKLEICHVNDFIGQTEDSVEDYVITGVDGCYADLTIGLMEIIAKDHKDEFEKAILKELKK